jgi:hypothetical protein
MFKKTVDLLTNLILLSILIKQKLSKQQYSDVMTGCQEERSVCWVTKHCNTHLRPLMTQMLIPHTTDTCNSRLSRDRCAALWNIATPIRGLWWPRCWSLDTCNSSSRDRCAALRNIATPIRSLWRPRCWSPTPQIHIIAGSQEIGVRRYETLQHPSEASDDPDVDPPHHRYI